MGENKKLTTYGMWDYRRLQFFIFSNFLQLILFWSDFLTCILRVALKKIYHKAIQWGTTETSQKSSNGTTVELSPTKSGARRWRWSGFCCRNLTKSSEDELPSSAPPNALLTSRSYTPFRSPTQLGMFFFFLLS